ncbi:MAG: GNAT family N-acetyltransferase [Hespellia sp.]|nr:GNAT family N-acetyltransferase [Hespellia sp.]
MEIRKIYGEEIETALQLIWETFLQFEAPDYSEQGVDSFYRFLSNQPMIDTLEFFGAMNKKELMGVIATNDHRKHICCFFVKARYHRQGVGRKLWTYLKDSSSNQKFTLNASPYAVPFYHKLGFTDTGKEKVSDGIRFTPMKYERGILSDQMFR